MRPSKPGHVGNLECPNDVLAWHKKNEGLANLEMTLERVIAVLGSKKRYSRNNQTSQR